MEKNKIAGIIKVSLLALFPSMVFAQQDAQFSQYMFNGLTLNPAYAGNKGTISLNSTYRYQWAGIEGAPKTMSLSCDGPFVKKKVGLGLNIINDKLGAQGLFSVFTNYAYRLQTGPSSTLSMGIAVGISQYSLDESKIVFYDDADNSKATLRTSELIPDAKFGLYFSMDNFYSGISVSNIFEQTISDQEIGREIIFIRQGRHYFLTTGYIAEINPYISLYPSILVKEDFRGPTNIDLNGMVLYKNLIWTGLSYRSSLALMNKKNLDKNLRKTDVMAFILGVNLSDRLRAGYAFDMTTSELRGYTSGSHEISLSYYIPVSKKYRILTPRYF